MVKDLSRIWVQPKEVAIDGKLFKFIDDSRIRENSGYRSDAPDGSAGRETLCCGGFRQLPGEPTPRQMCQGLFERHWRRFRR